MPIAGGATELARGGAATAINDRLGSPSVRRAALAQRSRAGHRGTASVVIAELHVLAPAARPGFWSGGAMTKRLVQFG